MRAGPGAADLPGGPLPPDAQAPCGTNVCSCSVETTCGRKAPRSRWLRLWVSRCFSHLHRALSDAAWAARPQYFSSPLVHSSSPRPRQAQGRAAMSRKKIRDHLRDSGTERKAQRSARPYQGARRGRPSIREGIDSVLRHYGHLLPGQLPSTAEPGSRPDPPAPPRSPAAPPGRSRAAPVQRPTRATSTTATWTRVPLDRSGPRAPRRPRCLQEVASRASA